MIYVIRNNQQFGPYDESTLVSYVNNGRYFCVIRHKMLRLQK